jgi:hypothetical protein
VFLAQRFEFRNRFDVARTFGRAPDAERHALDAG